MTREEKIQRLTEAKQILTFEEWYKVNQDAFILGKVKKDPKQIYDEYVTEILGE